MVCLSSVASNQLILVCRRLVKTLLAGKEICDLGQDRKVVDSLMVVLAHDSVVVGECPASGF